MDYATGIGVRSCYKTGVQQTYENGHQRAHASLQWGSSYLRLSVLVFKTVDVYAAESPWVPSWMVAIANPRYIQKIDTEWGKFRLKK